MITNKREWEVILYETNKGVCPFLVFFNNIEQAEFKAKILKDIELLKEFGNLLRRPHSAVIKDKRGIIFELRSKYNTNIVRIFYYFEKDFKIVILNGFVKKTNKTPKNEIEKAFKFIKDLEGRKNV